MGYTLKMFRNEVIALSSNPNFLEDEENLPQFSNEQYESLKNKLKRYKYEIESTSDKMTSYRFKDGKNGITAYLTKNCLTFTCAGGEEHIFEILMTSSELCPKGLSVLNLQEGTWESSLESEENIIREQETSNKKIDKTSLIETQVEKNNANKPWWKFW